MLSMGIGTAAMAETNSAAPQAQVETENEDDGSSKLGLIGLVGLLGLAGLFRGGGGKRSGGGGGGGGSAKPGKTPRGGHTTDWSSR